MGSARRHTKTVVAAIKAKMLLGSAPGAHCLAGLSTPNAAIIRVMENLQLKQTPVMTTAMLIRRPAAEVFEAFVYPEITRRFWFTRSTGQLEPGKHITWTWEMYNHSVEVNVKEIELNKRILIEWGNYGSMTAVEWTFTPYENDWTYVTITNSGFTGDGDKVLRDALDSKGGFTWVLAGLKALLEHNIELNAIVDAFPPGVEH